MPISKNNFFELISVDTRQVLVEYETNFYNRVRVWDYLNLVQTRPVSINYLYHILSLVTSKTCGTIITSWQKCRLINREWVYTMRTTSNGFFSHEFVLLDNVSWILLSPTHQLTNWSNYKRYRGFGS